jgi:hypothetical protein
MHAQHFAFRIPESTVRREGTLLVLDHRNGRIAPLILSWRLERVPTMPLDIRPLGGRAQQGLGDPVIPTVSLSRFTSNSIIQALVQHFHFSAARTAD